MPIKVDRPRLPFPTEPDQAKTGQNSAIGLDRVDRIGGGNLTEYNVLWHLFHSP